MIRELHFTVQGRPAPKGSMRHIGNGVMIEQSKYVGPWREAIHFAALEALDRWDFVQACGPVFVKLDLFLAKPASNRDDQPTNRRTGDSDKHARAVLDALETAGVLADDSQVISLHVRKRWAFGRPPGADIGVYELTPPYELTEVTA